MKEIDIAGFKWKLANNINNKQFDTLIKFQTKSRLCDLQNKLTPWLWTGRTKVVRTHSEMNGDPVGHRRLAAIEGGVYEGQIKQKIMTFYLVYLKPLFLYLIQKNVHDCGSFY